MPLMTMPDILSDEPFHWDERRVRVVDNAPMRSYQLRAAYKIFTGEARRCPHTGKKIGPERDGTAVHIDPGLGRP